MSGGVYWREFRGSLRGIGRLRRQSWALGKRAGLNPGFTLGSHTGHPRNDELRSLVDKDKDRERNLSRRAAVLEKEIRDFNCFAVALNDVGFDLRSHLHSGPDLEQL